MAKPTEPKPLDLNDAANILFAAAAPPLNDILPEICASAGVQPWQLILGHLMKADQRAELHAPLLMDEWTADSPTPSVVRSGKCRCCRRVMTRNPNADFCCNYCGSGRYEKEQAHHPDCEFFIKPQRHLTLPASRGLLPPTPPEDKTERDAYEEAAFAQHQREALAAENAPGGLPPLPDDLNVDPRQSWAPARKG